ncbi:MAG: ATP-dependent protease LonB [Desulfotomaculum sp.]|nr:ATP-dependent protease LonB [Desulfotomaculum sp.]
MYELNAFGSILIMVQVIFAVVIGMYFLNLLKAQYGNKNAIERESVKETEKLQRLRAIALTEPLSEKTRPKNFRAIIGQKDGLKSLRAALCGPNPQHVIIYGPPGVGKTAVARLILEEAKNKSVSPFKKNAKFVEIDACTVRFDERGIADSLIGSVHDPIYQGAGALGVAGIPQPKAGAVTKAHGGVLFIDEIGELHPVQMNKLLKVLEDRKVFLESAYYSSEDPNIPRHIHDIFQNGLPADFRLVGATTRTPDEIPPAIRSRCLEIFFRPLSGDEIGIIAANAAAKVKMPLQTGALEVIQCYANNGREAVNIVQIAAGIIITEKRSEILVSDIEWVINSGRYSPRLEKIIAPKPQVGVVNGLAVFNQNIGTILEVEVSAIAAIKSSGEIIVTGVAEEEEITLGSRKIRRKSMAKASVENILTVLRRTMKIDYSDYDIHINFPGGFPVDGPSAGVTIATAVYSAISGIPVDNKVAMTGEVSILGLVKPVGGVVSKINAALKAGITKVYIPKENNQKLFSEIEGIKILAVEKLEEIIDGALINSENNDPKNLIPVLMSTLVAAPVKCERLEL